jgi:MFS superfamily sulfate permease-like transporter
MLSGVMLLLMGVARLGFVADFLSEPVLSAFTTASAVLIVLSQLGPLAGLHLPGSSLPQWLLGISQQFAGLAAASRWGVGTALLLLLRRWGEAALQCLGMPAAVASVLLRAAPVVLMLASLLLPRNGRCRWWGRFRQGCPWRHAAHSVPAGRSGHSGLLHRPDQLCAEPVRGPATGGTTAGKWTLTANCWRWACAMWPPGWPVAFR